MAVLVNSIGGIKMNNKVNINSKNDKEKQNNIKKSKCVWINIKIIDLYKNI